MQFRHQGFVSLYYFLLFSKLESISLRCPHLGKCYHHPTGYSKLWSHSPHIQPICIGSLSWIWLLFLIFTGSTLGQAIIGSFLEHWVSFLTVYLILFLTSNSLLFTQQPGWCLEKPPRDDVCHSPLRTIQQLCLSETKSGWEKFLFINIFLLINKEEMMNEKINI